ncbi:MAG TPA: DDE-type integrase/transposase/recombinase, partial [Chlamydiales bacterium]|nr:DDE-type integrase/transposase/recombinase [Chlamydiales bacterium]
MVLALPSSFEVTKQAILASVSKLSDLSPTDVRQRILSEELRQGSSVTVNAIRTVRKQMSGKGNCFWCEGNHWEAECQRKARGLTREQARTERKKSNEKRKQKGKVKGKTKDNKPSSELASSPSVNAIFTNASSTPPLVHTVANTSGENTTAFLFYIAECTQWMLDSGCFDHITSNMSDFSHYTSTSRPSYITLADKKTKIEYRGYGTVIGMTKVDGQERKIILQQVLYCPTLEGRFLSLTSLTEKDITLTFQRTKAALILKGQVTAYAHQHNRQWWVPLSMATPSINSMSSTLPIEVLHQRLGHLSWSALKYLGQDLDRTTKRKLSTCEGCLLGKSTRRSYPSSSHRSTEPFQLVHMDLCGPMQTRSLEGHDYFMIMVDDYTRFLWVPFLLKKDEAFSHYRNFVNMVSTNFEHKIKGIRSDRGGEFLSKDFKQFLLNQGTTHQLTAPDTPQQNGMAERANRTVVQAAKAMLHMAGLSYGFWERAVETAVFARNHSPTQSLSYKSPYELLFGRQPDIAFMRVFGCLAYRNVTSDNRQKLDPSSERLTFVGYDNQTKGYKLWDG